MAKRQKFLLLMTICPCSNSRSFHLQAQGYETARAETGEEG